MKDRGQASKRACRDRIDWRVQPRLPSIDRRNGASTQHSQQQSDGLCLRDEGLGRADDYSSAVPAKVVNWRDLGVAIKQDWLRFVAENIRSRE